MVSWQRFLKRSHVAAHSLTQYLSATADVAHLTSLSRLTHLDLGPALGVVALAQQLSNLQSLALHMPYSHTLVSAVQKQFPDKHTHHVLVPAAML